MTDGAAQRLPDGAHTSRPWRIHELTRDFRLEDVWALPTPGGPDDFPRLVRLMVSSEPAAASSLPARALWAIRRRIGALLGWDDAGRPGGPTLRDRLPADLRAGPAGPDREPFASLYLTGDEWAAEIVNRTVHAVRHVGWVRDGPGGHRGQMAVLVRPNGRLGAAYLAAIRPLRRRVVDPSTIRAIGRCWRRC
jgi:hypothetical protein